MDKNKPEVYEEGGRPFSSDDSVNKESQDVITEVGNWIKYHVIQSIKAVPL